MAALAVAGCSAPGSSTGSSPGAGAGSASTPTDAAPRLISPDDFGAEVDRGERFVLNAHTPDEGSIEGTDASVPFDQLDARAAELPADRDTPLAVYCQTGSMSEVAVVTLTEMGFTDVVELRGGMVAWTDSGRMVLAPASSSGGQPSTSSTG